MKKLLFFMGGQVFLSDLNGRWYLFNQTSYTISELPTGSVDTFNELGQILYMYEILK